MAQGKSKLLSLTPVLDTSIYASADQMGALTEIPYAGEDSGDTGIVLNLTVVDKEKQSALFYMHLFSDKPVITSVDNAALSIADSEMGSKFIGTITVNAGDYITTAVNTIATVTAGFLYKCTVSGDNQKGTSLWFILESGGTPTYAAGSLVLKLGLLQD